MDIVIIAISVQNVRALTPFEAPWKTILLESDNVDIPCSVLTPHKGLHFLARTGDDSVSPSAEWVF